MSNKTSVTPCVCLTGAAPSAPFRPRRRPDELDLDQTIQTGAQHGSIDVQLRPNGAMRQKYCCFSMSAARWIGMFASACIR